jgi:glycolate oxidase
MLQRDDQQERDAGHRAVREIFEHAVALGGTISGEHGIGYAKAPFLDIALTAPTIELMRTIKRAMDPNGILNPGKMFV